ncbi:MAG: hypothetical protein ACRD1B_11475, partial [Thermoanaerobaculia bacterium]
MGLREEKGHRPPPNRRDRSIAALVAVGVLARVVRYLACFPLWEAEAYAAATLVDRGFGDLARPLDYQT